jgi:hypothetical protein
MLSLFYRMTPCRKSLNLSSHSFYAFLPDKLLLESTFDLGLGFLPLSVSSLYSSLMSYSQGLKFWSEGVVMHLMIDF